jgi:hypothetical protein
VKKEPARDLFEDPPTKCSTHKWTWNFCTANHKWAPCKRWMGRYLCEVCGAVGYIKTLDKYYKRSDPDIIPYKCWGCKSATDKYPRPNTKATKCRKCRQGWMMGKGR